MQVLKKTEVVKLEQASYIALGNQSPQCSIPVAAFGIQGLGFPDLGPWV